MYVVGEKMARNGRETAIWSVANFGDQSLLPAWAWHYQQIATPTFSESPIFHASQACLAKVIGYWFCQTLQIFLYKK